MSTEANIATPIAGPSYVYLLKSAKHPFVKIGTSLDPVRRAAGLQTPIHLALSIKVQFPSERLAHRAERYLHRRLSKYNVAQDKCLDGHTEWFSLAAVRLALEMLATMGGAGPAPVTAQHRDGWAIVNKLVPPGSSSPISDFAI